MKITFTRIFYLLITLLVAFVLLFSLARLASPWLNNYKPQIEEYASKQLGMSVKIKEMHAGWYYFNPVIHLSNVQIENNAPQLVEQSEQPSELSAEKFLKAKPLVVIDDIAIGIGFFSSLWHWSIQPNVLIISQANIRLEPSLLSDKPFDPEPLLRWILDRNKVILRDMTLSWINLPVENPLNSNSNDTSSINHADNIFIKQPSFKLSSINLKLKKSFYSHSADLQFDWIDLNDRVIGNSSGPSLTAIPSPMHFSATADFSAHKPDIKTWEGSFLTTLKNIDLTEWQSRILPYFSETTQSKLLAIEITDEDNQVQWSGSFNEGKVAQNFELTTQDFKMINPAVFNAPVFFSTIHLNVNWGNLDENVNAHVIENKINVEEFFIENPQISAKTTGTVFLDNALNNPSSPLVNLETQFVLQDVPAITRYLPYKIMKPKLSQWLQKSIIAGDASGKMILKGHLSDFPFENMSEEQGLFLVDSDWQKFSLDYKPEWPLGKLMHAHIIFKNRDLSAEINEGMIDQLPLSNVKAQIPALGSGKETLMIQGNLNTDAANARHFVLNSGLKKNLSAFEHMYISGPAVFDVDIQIPLYPENNDNIVNGKVNFLGGEFILPEWWDLHFKQFNGWLTYNQIGIVDSQLNANLLNYPLKLRMQTVAKPKIATQVDISGQLGIDTLKKLFDISLFDFMKGKMFYNAQLLLTPSPTDQDTLTLKSNLQGIAIKLPKPFGKKVSEKQSLLLLLNFSDVMDTLLSVHYKNQVSVHLAYNRVKKEYHFKRGKIHLGGTEKAPPTEDGLKVDGSLPEFTLSDWMPFFKKMSHTSGAPSAKGKEIIILQGLQIAIGKLNIMGEIIDNALIQLSEKNKVWNAYIKSNEITGNIQIPDNIQSGISAQLDYLHVTHQDEEKKSTLNYQPKDVPPLNIQINDLQYNKVSMGKVRIKTEKDSKNNTLIIKDLNIQSPGTTIDLKGSWALTDGLSKSKLLGYLSSTNIKQTLINFNQVPVMQGEKALISFNLNWPDSFNHFHVATLNGLMDLKVGKGVITHLDKSIKGKVGLGQILGLLSPQNLFKSLTLDFSELSTKGLPFDSLTGNFAIQQGKMTTNNTELDSSVADVAMKGTIDLGLKTYDLLFHVAPHSATSSLPIIATIAGGPIAGLATLAASALIKQGMKHSSMYTYKVVGPWKHPKVVSEDKKR